jgi:acetyl esterase/lipase
VVGACRARRAGTGHSSHAGHNGTLSREFPRSRGGGRAARAGLTAPHRFRTAGARDVAYGPHGRENLLDVWRHPDLPTDAGAPVLVEIHGGARSSGRKEGEANPLMGYLVERGRVCVTVNYRLGPGARWPAMIDDVRAALRWVHAHVGEHGAPPFFVLHGSGDAIVVPEQSRAFVRALRSVSEQVVAYAELPHAQHGFDLLPTPRARLVVRAVEAFLVAALGRRPAQRGGAVAA